MTVKQTCVQRWLFTDTRTGGAHGHYKTFYGGVFTYRVHRHDMVLY
jgi:hypothetical protein